VRVYFIFFYFVFIRETLEVTELSPRYKCLAWLESLVGKKTEKKVKEGKSEKRRGKRMEGRAKEKEGKQIKGHHPKESSKYIKIRKFYRILYKKFWKSFSSTAETIETSGFKNPSLFARNSFNPPAK
jgi:hypothetical protein